MQTVHHARDRQPEAQFTAGQPPMLGLDGMGDRITVAVRLRALGDGHGVGVRQEQAEAFGEALEIAATAATVQQVVLELPPGGLSLPHVRGIDGLLGGAEKVVGGGLEADPGGPAARRRGERG
ncbi:hypothetical protein [Streptomyces sp. NBC_01718]|uniref:hypothetical protein n=1 Tax=Streptomyces sp. NBC_01718 TaxID=2975919 RepID=UPI00352D86D8